MRTAAELMLSPYRPAARISIGTGTLRLDIGGKVDIPGVITRASQITGAVRQAMGAAIMVKQMTQMIGGMVQQTINDVNRLQGVVTSGAPTLAASIAGNIPIPGIPGAAAFFQLSALRPGQTLPASYTSILKDRKNQLQALAGRMSSVASMAGFGGVTVQENYQRTTYPLANEVDKPSMPKLAVGGTVAQQDDILRDKSKFVVSGVQVAQGKPSFWSRFTSLKQVKAAPGYNPILNQLFKDRSSSAGWSEPASKYASQFPYNKVTATESGHIFEMDDTPAAERVHIFHRSGSFIEWHPNGTVVYKNMKDGYFITMNDQFIKVAGNCHISVDGKATIYVKKDLNVQSDGEVNITAKKDFNVYAHGSINLRAKKTFKGDGTKIDLRYISLPLAIHPVMGALVPRVNLAALRADYPTGNFDAVLAQAAKGPLDPKTVNTLLKFNQTAVAVPLENPLSNPGVYTKKTAAAVDYRARMFDTPEETQNFEVYNSHIDLQRMLGDIPRTGDPRPLGGQVISSDETLPTNVPAVTYLNFDNYKGNFTYAADQPLSASFKLRDLVDTALFPAVVPRMSTAAMPTPEGGLNADEIDTVGTTGQRPTNPNPGAGGSGGAGGGGSDTDAGGRGGRAGDSA